MAEPELDAASVPHVPIPTRGRPLWLKGMACVAILPLMGFIGQTGRSLWGEWRSLRQEQDSERSSVVVGYINITPKPSYAARPDDWFHDEGDDSLLWSGWRDGKNHWFRIARGDLEGHRLSMPIGRDVIQAIDQPIYERASGACWDRVPSEAPVAGFDGEGAAIAYPIRVLDKVEVVNDRVVGRPVLVVYSPAEGAVSMFEATLDARPVTMGHGGYFLGKHPVLYDRKTESLWSERDGAMVSVAGLRKGAALKRVARLDVVAWNDWRAGHPDGRLLIGADRSRPMPVD